MKYSYNWLQKHIAAPLPKPADLEQKIIFHAFEVEENEQVGTDTVFEIKVLPDRAGDALSHYGMAREIAGMHNLPLHIQAPTPFIEKREYPVSIETELCTRYALTLIEGVSVKESTKDIQALLSSVGQKSINTIADATNYVLLDSGQPTHAFDADKIVGTLTVRHATEGETIITLSDEEKILTASDIVIADDVGPLAIAGIKGGKRAEITTETKNVLLEVAHFDATTIRKTARRLGLVTDAAKRFENNISPEVVSLGMAQLVALVQEVAGGVVLKQTDIYQTIQPNRELRFAVKDITRILGEQITAEHIESVFTHYGYQYTKENDGYVFAIPYYRQDITQAADIAEEVGRVVGYAIIPNTPLPFTPRREENELDKKIQNARAYCILNGYSEVMTYSFCKKGEISVVRGPKNKSDLRTNLTDGIAASFELNRLNAPLLGVAEVKLFEIGTVFNVSGTELSEEVRIALVDKKGVQEFSIDEFISTREITETLVLPESTQAFVPWSSYPFIVRDVAVWLTEGDSETKEKLDALVTTFAKEHTTTPAILFDTFSKEGKASYAYRLVFQSYEHTLTDGEVADKIAPLLAQIVELPGAELR